MADPRSPLKEFRVLDQKRAGEGLTPAEEARWEQLRELVEPDLAGGAGGGFDVNAAAARLRESLSPPGARGGAPAEPAVAAPSDLEAELFGPSEEGEPGGPLFDDGDALAALDAGLGAAEPRPEAADASAWTGEPAAEGGGAFDAGAAAAPPWDPDAPAWDPAQPYDPNAAPHDASQPYDPNAAPYDASQPYDPNAAPYDPSQPYDPSTAPYDASQPYDPNAAPYDPSQPYDPNAAPYDPSQPYDPNAAAFEPAQPLDSGAPFDAAQAGEPGALAPPWDAELAPLELAGEAGAEPLAADGAWAGPEPFDVAGAPPAADADGSAWDPGALLDAASPGADAPAWPEAGDADATFEATAAFALPGEAEALHDGDPSLELGASDAAAPLVADASPLPPAGWAADAEPSPSLAVDPGALGEYDETGGAPSPGALGAVPDDAGVASAEPFDLAALPDGAPALAPELGEYDDTAGFAGTVPELAPPDLGEDASGFHAAQGLGDGDGDGAAFAAEADAVDEFALASGGSFDATAAAAAPEWAGGVGPAPWEEPGAAGGGPDAANEEALGAEADPLAETDAAPSHEAALADALDVAAEALAPVDLPGEEGVLAPSADLDAPAPLPELPLDDAGVPDLAFVAGTGPDLAEEPDAGAHPELAADVGAPAAEELAASPPVATLDLAAAAPPAADAALEDLDIDIDVDDIAASIAAEPEPYAPGDDAGAAEALAGGPADGEPELAPELGGEVGPEAEPELAPLLPRAEPALDFSRPDFSEGAPEDDDPYLAPRGTPPLAAAPPQAAAPAAAPAPRTGALPQLELEDFGDVRDGVPTIEGEEILEEIPDGALPPHALDFAAPLEPTPAAEPAPAVEPEPEPESAPPAPAAAGATEPPPPPAPPALPPTAPAPAPAETVPAAVELPCRVPGVHRVVLHTIEGQVRRGILDAPDLAAAALALAPQPGAPAEDVATERVKAIFFMLSPGEAAPAAEGRKVRVTFKDGRQVAGFSPDYAESGPGFFMVPGDTRTNTGRIWIYRAAARAISVS